VGEGQGEGYTASTAAAYSSHFLTSKLAKH
jgi:hypothetical protein